MGCLWLRSTHRLQPVIDTSTLNQLLLSLAFYYPAFHTYHLLHRPKSKMEPENHTFATTSFLKPESVGSIFIVRSAPQVSFLPKKRHQSRALSKQSQANGKGILGELRHIILSDRPHPWHDESDGPDGDTRLSCQTSHDQNVWSSHWLVVNWDMFF